MTSSTDPTASAPSVPFPHSFRTFLLLVREDYRTNGSDWRFPGFQALFAYRMGNFRLGLPASPTKRALKVVDGVLQRRARNRFGIEIKATAKIGRRVRIVHQNGIVLHSYAVIGDDCWIRQGVTIGGGGDWSRDDHPIIGRDVRIGAGAVLMGTFVVGDGARIGPNSVVSRNVPEGALVVHPPSRVLRP